MAGEQDESSENPYDAPRHPPVGDVNRGRRQPMPWWARPDAPSILVALPIVVVLVVGVVVAFVLPIIGWLVP